MTKELLKHSNINCTVNLHFKWHNKVKQKNSVLKHSFTCIWWPVQNEESKEKQMKAKRSKTRFHNEAVSLEFRLDSTS
jgi:hypothetical protein